MMKKISKLKSIGQAFRLIWSMDKWLMIYNIFISLIQSAIPFIGILLSAYVLEGLQSGAEAKKLITVSLSSVSAVFLLTLLKSYLEKCNEVHIDMCGKTYDTLMSMKTITMDYPLLDSPMINEIRTRIQNDNSWGAGFYSLVWLLPWLLQSFLSMIVSVALIIPLLLHGGVFQDITAPVLLLLFGGVIIFTVKSNASLEKKYLEYQNDPSDETSISYTEYFLWGDQNYHHGKDIRIYDAKPLIQKRIDGNLQEGAQVVRGMTKNRYKSGLIGGFADGVLEILAYIFVVLRAASGALSIGAVVRYAGIISQFANSVSTFFWMVQQYQIAADRQESTLEYLNIEDVMKKGTLPVEKRAFCDDGDNDYEIEFRNVSFHYPGADTYALRHINMKFNVGQRLAVVGMNGSGKTTFIKLLCRLYDPTDGEILLNGINIKKYDYDEYTSIFSVVFQDFTLFSFGLGQNVAASVAYDKNRVEACLEKAGFGERLSKMPKGLDTCLYKDFEEDGLEISGGEAQKIAIARALYKDAPFIVLDEPTAALDPIAETEIYSKFNEIAGDKTAIYISHRLSSCRFCDEIAVFHQGSIVQQGSHEALLANANGKYSELWNAQAQYYTED